MLCLIRLYKIVFERQGFKNENTADFELEVNIGTVVGESKNRYKVTLILKGKKEDEYSFLIQLSGFFSVDGANLSENVSIDDLLQKNAVAILMPYLRSEASLLTAQPETESIILPVFNINQMLERDENDLINE